MRTFSLGSGASEKFWHVQRTGNRLVLTSGTAGGESRTRTQTFPDDWDARWRQDELIQNKLAAGYVETTGMGPMPPVRRALEAALAANPDDIGAHMAYADWLQEQGDPRGEFIRVQLALEDESRPAAERRKLRKREEELQKAHAGEWLGPLAPWTRSGHQPGLQVRFARGWIDSLAVDFLGRSLAALLAWEPRLRLVRRLSIYCLHSFEEEGGEDEPPVAASADPVDEGDDSTDVLVRSPYLTNIRVLALGGGDSFADAYSEPSDYNSVHEQWFGRQFWEWIERLKGLEELYVEGVVLSAESLFGSEGLKHLRVLQVFLSDSYPLKVLAGNEALGNLTHLALRPQPPHATDEDAPFIKLGGVRALLTSPHLPRLTHLRLQATDLGDKGCTAIVRSGILKRLKFLDLARGSITDAGAHTLARCPDLTHLEVLDLSCNALTDAGLAAIRAAGVNVRATDQHDPDDTAYLYEGEWE